MILRPFTFADYPAALVLWKGTEGLGLSAADEPDAIAAFLHRNPGLSFAAEDNGRMVGTILCGHDGRRGQIYHLTVAKEHRRQGIARALLRHGLRALRDVGIDKCHMLVFQANSAGRVFWSDVGAEERVDLALFSLFTEDTDSPAA